MSVLETVWEGVSNSLLMAWTGLVGARLRVCHLRDRAGVGSAGPHRAGTRRPRRASHRPGDAARGASSSCSYAAVAIAKSLFAKGASAASALAFQFASTNLVVELGALIWVLLGWQFALAELVAGLLLIAIMTVLLRMFVSPRLEREAREHAVHSDAGHQHHSAGQRMPLRQRLRSADAWSDVAHNFRNDWATVYREIALGFLVAGFIGLLGSDFFNELFVVHAPAPLRLAENVLVGPLIAILSFVCSVGNIPLAAVLWSGGISFAGVIAFIFADLLVLPIVAI